MNWSLWHLYLWPPLQMTPLSQKMADKSWQIVNNFCTSSTAINILQIYIYIYLCKKSMGKIKGKFTPKIEHVLMWALMLSSTVLSKMYILQSCLDVKFQRCKEFVNALKTTNCFHNNHLDLHESSSRCYFSRCLFGCARGLMRTNVILENESKA